MLVGCQVHRRSGHASVEGNNLQCGQRLTAGGRVTLAATKSARECILIVDDDREAGKSLAKMLADTGYEEIRTVRSAARALAVAATFHPVLAFLGTPGAAGSVQELASQLQNGARPRGIRLIALTDSAEHPTREEARATGVERYLTRPVTQIELDKVMRKPA
jgi:chemosensory pili system protein ChpA (sensor histidine kinase/response regulator)